MDRLAQEDFALLSGKSVALVVNQTSLLRTATGERHVVDVLAERDDIEVAAIFTPEHGLRGEVAAGERVADGVDEATGLPVLSLYGDRRAPSASDLVGVDVVVIDLQDVGARYYTYTSTLGLVMAAAADNGVAVVVTDRPNPQPLGRAAGPMLVDAQSSFVGLYPVPSLHDLTIGELALAIRGEGWLEAVDGVELTVVPVSDWSPGSDWASTGRTWVPPSPGLPRAETAVVYPSLVLMEATTVSFGQGTEQVFEHLGAPWLDAEAVAAALNQRSLPGARFVVTEFTPRSTESAPRPRHVGLTMPGIRVEVTDAKVFDGPAVGVAIVADIMARHRDRTIIDRPEMFDLLSGTERVRLDLEAGVDPSVIAAGWSGDLERYEASVEPYRLYDR